MRFKIDENLSKEIAELLTNAGHDAVRVDESMRRSAQSDHQSARRDQGGEGAGVEVEVGFVGDPDRRDNFRQRLRSAD